MKTSEPFLFEDFRQAHEQLRSSLEQHEHYALLCGESGSGKTTLLRLTQARLDRCHYRWVYFNIAQLQPGGLARLLARSLRLPILRSQPETLQSITRTLADEPTRLVITIDEAHRLPDETLAELYTLAEADLERDLPISILLSALPALRERLQSPGLFPLWRRITRRLEITGLRRDELLAFVEHQVGAKISKRLEEAALVALAEHGRGLPGLILPYLQHILQQIPAGAIAADQVDSLLQQWNLS
ncbi:MAG: ATP-binding protein [Planctomycetota bacterium]